MQEAIADRKSTLDPDRACVDPRPFAPGYPERDFKRLETPSAVIGDLTEDVLQRAGVDRGMSVLDLGCGVGDVSLLAGWLVGPSGSVLGVDRSAEAVATAERRAAEAGQRSWVQFAASDLDIFVPDRTFDAIIGRLVLMYLPEPAATLRRLSDHLRPGGIVLAAGLPAPRMIALAPGRRMGAKARMRNGCKPVRNRLECRPCRLHPGRRCHTSGRCARRDS